MVEPDAELFGYDLDTYHDLRNHYMHKVLSTHMKTLPLSLVAVFVGEFAV